MKYNKRGPVNLVLDNLYISNPNLLKDSEEFVSKLKDITLNSIRENLENPNDDISLFNIIDLGIKVSINKKNQKKFLNNLLNEHTLNEEYDKCSEISEFIKNLNK